MGEALQVALNLCTQLVVYLARLRERPEHHGRRDRPGDYGLISEDEDPLDLRLDFGGQVEGQVRGDASCKHGRMEHDQQPQKAETGFLHTTPGRHPVVSQSTLAWWGKVWILCEASIVGLRARKASLQYNRRFAWGRAWLSGLETGDVPHS